MIRLSELSKERRARLEEARNFYQFIEDHEDEEAWLVEKQRICKADISAKDLRGVLSLQQKHKVSKWLYIYVYIHFLYTKHMKLINLC